MKKIALLFVCVNPPYWQFLPQVIQSCDEFLFRDKKLNEKYSVDYFVWSDIPEMDDPVVQKFLPQEQLISHIASLPEAEQEGAKQFQSRESVTNSIKKIRERKDITIFPIGAAPWPSPTLMRYHLFLQQEEKLKEYDYILYMDVDMLMVSHVGEEILGQGLIVAEHPMYSLRREYIPPYEPNNQSTAYIPRLGVVLNQDGKPWLKPVYAAGGFQGGTSETFIPAMKSMKEAIDKDFSNNYVAIWNDESHWNKYLFGYTGHLTVLSPSYVYPDSLIEEYYVKAWGTRYAPKIITLTKSFTTTKKGAQDLHQKLASM